MPTVTSPVRRPGGDDGEAAEDLLHVAAGAGQGQLRPGGDKQGTALCVYRIGLYYVGLQLYTVVIVTRSNISLNIVWAGGEILLVFCDCLITAENLQLSSEMTEDSVQLQSLVL